MPPYKHTSVYPMKEGSNFDEGSNQTSKCIRILKCQLYMCGPFCNFYFNNNDLELKNSFQNGHIFFFKNLPALHVGWERESLVGYGYCRWALPTTHPAPQRAGHVQFRCRTQKSAKMAPHISQENTH